MKKWIKRIVVVVALLVVAAGVALWLGLDYFAKKGLEAGGTAALGVETTVDSVNVGLVSSSVTLNDLRIANPEGYKTDKLFKLMRGKLACNVPSFFGSHSVIDLIQIDSPDFAFEMRAGLPPKTNIGDLIAKLDSDKEERKAEPAKREGEKTFEIKRIRITDAKVRFHLLAGKTADIPLGDIEIDNLTNDDGTPLILADVLRQLFANVAARTFEKGKGVLPDDILQGFGATLGSARTMVAELAGTATKVIDKTAGKVLDKAGKTLGDGATKALGDTGGKVTGGAKKVVGGAGKKVTDALGGILGGKKKKDEKEK